MELDLEAELAFTQKQADVSSEELLARNKDVPELGVGRALLEMSEFLGRKAERDAT